jgi:predicted porin
MNKKLMAVAVAGALAVPGIALAQSSVTISGMFKMSLENLKIDDTASTRTGNTSETRLTDDSSRIIFGVKEDLGDGLMAVGQVDMRTTLDTGGISAAGNSFVGLSSKTMGTLTAGRNDLHYFGRESYLTAKADLKADSISILAFAGGGGMPIANATRTPNTLKYTSPKWGGIFQGIIAYTTSPVAASEADIGSNARKGYGLNLNPNFSGSNWRVGFSNWVAKPDGSAGASLAAVPGFSDQTGQRVYGSYDIAGFRIGLAYDHSKLNDKTSTACAGATSCGEWSKRGAWSIPIQYNTGPHTIYFHYDVAQNDKGSAFENGGYLNTANQDSGAKMYAIAYAYDLSKRTSVAVTYGQITNDPAASYNFFTSTSGIGSSDAGVLPGEDPKLFSVTVAHYF